MIAFAGGAAEGELEEAVAFFEFAEEDVL